MCSCRAVRLGGNPNNGAYVGVLNFNANNAPSNANWNYGGGLLPLTGLKIIFVIILNKQSVWIRLADSQCFIRKYIKPFINIKDMEEIISNENKKYSITAIAGGG